MKKQGYNSRLDESLGMRRGAESGKSQSYKSRRDESRGSRSYARKNNERYMSKGLSGKVMGHDKSPKEVIVPCGNGFSEVRPFRSGMKGYPKSAFDYKY